MFRDVFSFLKTVNNFKNISNQTNSFKFKGCMFVNRILENVHSEARRKKNCGVFSFSKTVNNFKNKSNQTNSFKFKGCKFVNRILENVHSEARRKKICGVFSFSKTVNNFKNKSNQTKHVIRVRKYLNFFFYNSRKIEGQVNGQRSSEEPSSHWTFVSGPLSN